jgi:hypothetical protein
MKFMRIRGGGCKNDLIPFFPLRKLWISPPFGKERRGGIYTGDDPAIRDRAGSLQLSECWRG